MKNQYWKSLAFGTMLTGAALAEAGKCAKCDEEAVPGAALCFKCLLNDMKEACLQNPECITLVMETVKEVKYELSSRPAPLPFSHGVLPAWEKEVKNIVEGHEAWDDIYSNVSVCLLNDIAAAFRILEEKAKALGDCIVAVPMSKSVPGVKNDLVELESVPGFKDGPFVEFAIRRDVKGECKQLVDPSYEEPSIDALIETLQKKLEDIKQKFEDLGLAELYKAKDLETWEGVRNWLNWLRTSKSRIPTKDYYSVVRNIVEVEEICHAWWRLKWCEALLEQITTLDDVREVIQKINDILGGSKRGRSEIVPMIKVNERGQLIKYTVQIRA